MVMNGWPKSVSNHANRSFQKRLFQVLTLKPQCQGHRSVVKGQIHVVNPVSNWLISVNFTSFRPTTPAMQLFQNLTLTNPRSKSRVRSKFRIIIAYPVSNWCTSISFHVNWATTHSWDTSNTVWPWKTHPKHLWEMSEKFPAGNKHD